jgi:glycosyltransferase involved in cell wall biosynthesis
MRILCITQPGSGVGYHRQMMPLTQMPDVTVLFTDFINDEVLGNGYDIVMVNRFAPGVGLDDLLDFRKRYEFKLVVDIDDYWHLDPWHVLYHSFPSKRIVNHIIAADLVTCTHRYLRQRIQLYNKNVEILPNALPFGKGQFHDERISHDKMSAECKPDALRVVYAGGVTHERDIEIIANPFKRIASDTWLKERTHFIMCGYDESNQTTIRVWHRMIHSYLFGFKLNGYVRGPLIPNEYMAFYNEADCTIAPLVDSEFNRCKSNLKVLEAAVKRIPIIVSDVHPYTPCPFALKVKSQGDWYRLIKELVKSKTLWTDAGEGNHQWCVENFHLDHWNKVRRQIYENLIA